MSPNEKPPKMWATRVNHIRRFPVHPTPDGLGIRIFTECVGVRVDTLYVFEIYPQSENPELAKIGELILHQPYEHLIFSLHGNRVIIYGRLKRTVIVWNFIANAVASWSIDSRLNLRDNIIGVTETNIIMCRYPNNRPTLWIFQIPPLITKTPSFDSEELDFPELPPVLTFAYPELTSLSQTPDERYCDDPSSLPLYFDMFKGRQRDVYVRCKLDIASDFSNVSFVPIIKPSLRCLPYDHLMEYRICEGRPVNVFRDSHSSPIKVYMGSASCGTAQDRCDSSRTSLSMPTPLAQLSDSFSFCPASGRLVHTVGEEPDGNIVICDFL